VAHELNNPLSGVLTYARLIKRELREQKLDPEVRRELEHYLNLVDKECTRCGAIVHNLLTFARRRGSDMAPVDLNGVVERSVMLVRHHLEMRGIRLEDSGDPTADGLITADAGQVEQALLALLMNAIEAMPPAEGAPHTLAVRLHAHPESVAIEVADTGVGIPPDALPHIFEPFFSTKGGENGVGLGLAVVYGIVNRHGGLIDIQTEVGRGTTIRLELPRTPPDATQQETARHKPAAAAG
jgi:two-component system NtrC family sensor kinase